MVVNDFIIPSHRNEQTELNRGRQFQIWFDIGNGLQQQVHRPPNYIAPDDCQGYYIKDLGVGFGVFKLIDVLNNQYTLMSQLGLKTSIDIDAIRTGCIILRDKMLVNIGETHIVFNLLMTKKQTGGGGQQSTLRLRIHSGSNYGQIYDFNTKQMDQGKRELLIGRAPECDVPINDHLLSKVQCHIKLQVDRGQHYWMLHDGCKGMASTNGTWMYINEDTKLFDGMTFKANQTIFKASLLPDANIN